MVLCTCPDETTALSLARALVERRLVACVNVLPAVQSVFRWQDEVVTESEAMLIIKTTQSALQPLQEQLVQLHPYDVPEVIALEISSGSRDYLDWLISCVRPDINI